MRLQGGKGGGAGGEGGREEEEEEYLTLFNIIQPLPKS